MKAYIWDADTGSHQEMAVLQGSLDGRPCGNRDAHGVICRHAATHWTVSERGIFPRCAIHTDDRRLAFIDTDGLHGWGDSIDDYLAVECECGGLIAVQRAGQCGQNHNKERPAAAPKPEGFSWANHDGTWYVTGPAGYAHRQVMVTRKDGSRHRVHLGSLLPDVAGYPPLYRTIASAHLTTQKRMTLF